MVTSGSLRELVQTGCTPEVVNHAGHAREMSSRTHKIRPRPMLAAAATRTNQKIKAARRTPTAARYVFAAALSTRCTWSDSEPVMTRRPRSNFLSEHSPHPVLGVPDEQKGSDEKTVENERVDHVPSSRIASSSSWTRGVARRLTSPSF